MIDLEIREGTLGDIPQLRKIDQLAYPNGWPIWSEENWHERIAYGSLFVATKTDPIGYIAGQAFDENVAVVDSLAVKPGWQRMGIGRLLMEKIIELCIGHSYKELRLMVRQSNQSALGLYESLGFVIDEAVDMDDELGKWGAYVMRRELT